MRQLGFAPLLLLLVSTVVIFVGGGLGYYFYHQSTLSNNLEAVSDATQESLNLAILSPSPTLPKTLLPTQQPTPTTIKKPTATPTPKATPTLTPTPTPSATCTINTLATPMDTNSNFDNPLTIELVYSAATHNNQYVTGAQWDFDGNGTWDTEMSLSNTNIAHTYPSNGNFSTKLQLKLSDGTLTPTCSKTVTVPMGTVVTISGQVFKDYNCNDVQEPNEQGIAGVPVSFEKDPGNIYNYATVTTDSNGHYSLTKVIDPQVGLTITPSYTALSGYKIHESYNTHTITLNNVQSSVNMNLPLIPNENYYNCVPY
ncbi:hypothetical protein M1563_01250 [Patescibacteria group bacterium]|nr:hypothetical protein [Patescibacteria group bacterium]